MNRHKPLLTTSAWTPIVVQLGVVLKRSNRIRYLKMVTEKKNCHQKPDSETVPGFKGLRVIKNLDETQCQA